MKQAKTPSHRYVRLFLLVLIQVSVLSAGNVKANENYNFVVLNFRGAEDLERWSTLATHISRSAGIDVSLSMLPPSAIIERADYADMLLVNPTQTAIIYKKLNFDIAATLNHKVDGHFLSGLIITHQDSSIRALTDLAGKAVAVVNRENAAGGFLFQAQELFSAGLKVEPDFRNFVVIPNQNAIIRRVFLREVDAGFVRSGQLEMYTNEHFNVSKIRIINEVTDEHGVSRSTAKYPNWGFLLNKRMKKSLRDDIARILLDIKEDSSVASAANIRGFVEPDVRGYEKLNEILILVNAGNP